LDAFALRDWEAFEEKLAQRPQYDDKLKPLRRHYQGSAVECEIDKLGRLLLPSELREYASLDSKLLWVGIGLRIEIWNPPDFCAGEDPDPTKPDPFAAMKARMTELGL
jgi:MraZ protein